MLWLKCKINASGFVVQTVKCVDEQNGDVAFLLSHTHQVTTGTTSLTPRWDKCVNYVENTLFYATGRLFVNAHFQEDKKHMVCSVFALMKSWFL